ncbi:hypothetical protein KCU76_g60, partial [Aureobasidium melanogenum]
MLEHQVLCQICRVKAIMVIRQKARGVYLCSRLWRLHPHQQLKWHPAIQLHLQPLSQSLIAKRHRLLLMQPVGQDLLLQQHTSSLVLSLQPVLSIRKQSHNPPSLAHRSVQ